MLTSGLGLLVLAGVVLLERYAGPAPARKDVPMRLHVDYALDGNQAVLELQRRHHVYKRAIERMLDCAFEARELGDVEMEADIRSTAEQLDVRWAAKLRSLASQRRYR
jgi:hypothetical protein